jgi:hypothetical protein
MKTRWRVIVAASAALLAAGTPALAQEQSASPDPLAPAPAQSDAVGPPQLKDFTLNGTVTRAAPAPVQVQPKPRQSTASSADRQSSQTGASPRPQPTRQVAESTDRSQSLAASEDRHTETPSIDSDLPRLTPSRRVATPEIAPTEEPSATPSLVPASSAGNVDASQNGLAVLPWLIAALALAGAAAWYFLRQRPRERYAAAGGIDLFEAPSPTPVPPPVRKAPRPVQKAPPPQPAPEPEANGIVSTRLRPWLEIEFKPERAIVDDDKAAVRFELSVLNTGNAPARDVLLEASLFNAGPMQDQQIQLFFDNPVAKGDRVPFIPPMQRLTVNTAVFLPRDKVRSIEIEGRTVFVPMIAFNALYGWGSNKGQTSASYLVGKTTNGEKLAPFRLDAGPRIFRNLAAREHELRLRK